MPRIVDLVGMPDGRVGVVLDVPPTSDDPGSITLWTPQEATAHHSRGWDGGIAQAAAWHDERERAMREVAEGADPDFRDKCVERANWHRDAAKAIRELAE